MKISFNVFLLITSAFIIQMVESKMNLDQLRNMLKPIKSTCVRKNAINPEIADDITQYLGNQNIPDQSFKCFIKCIVQMLKIIKNDNINTTALMQQIEALVVEELVDRFKEISTICQETASQTDQICEKSYIFLKCFYEMEPDLFFL